MTVSRYRGGNAAPARTGIAPPPGAPDAREDTSIEALFKKHAPEIALALPKHVTVERLMRIVLSEVRKNPRLGQCTPVSLLVSAFNCAALGLEPGGILGHAYLIPYWNGREKRNECQFQIGYRGMLDIARRSGQIESISARVVYSNDEFEYFYGLNEDVIHRPGTGQRGEVVAAYAVAKLKDGGRQFEVMNLDDLLAVRDNSQGYRQAAEKGWDNPWISNFDEMCRKTTIRRLFKYLPVSIEVMKAASLDEYGERGQHQESELDGILGRLAPEAPPAMPTLRGAPEPAGEPEAVQAVTVAAVPQAAPAAAPEAEPQRRQRAPRPVPVAQAEAPVAAPAEAPEPPADDETVGEVVEQEQFL
jgi:recombination protein RecT